MPGKRFLTLLALCMAMFLAVSAHLSEPENPGHESKHGSKAHARLLHDFEIVTVDSPARHQFKTQRRSVQAREQRDQPFPDELHLEFDAFNTTFVFDLRINEYLMHPNINLVVHGKKRSWEEPVPHTYYKGTAKSRFGEGWARLTLEQSPHGDHLVATGAFVQDGEVFQIFTPEEFQKLKTHVVAKRHERKRASEPDVSFVLMKEGDVEVLDPHAETCGTYDTQYNKMADDGHRHLTNPLAEFDLKHEKRVAAGCPTSDKQLYIGVMSDCTFTKLYPSTAAVKSAILSNFNKISALYESSFNVILGIVEIQIRTDCGSTPADAKGGTLAWNVDCSSSYTISNRLSDFSRWRGVQTADAGLWHLYSNCPTGSTIGIAWLNMLCQTSSFSQTDNGATEYVSGVGITTQVDNTWIVSAHEIGHNFGAKHDCTSTCSGPSDSTCCSCGTSTCDCASQYIMNPSNSITTETFSACTKTLACSRSAITGTCLAEPGSKTILNENVCGNGVWEPPAEECDCGGTLGCKNNTCCRANCTLYPTAKCSDTNSACCKNCTIIQNPAASNITCRAVASECDVAEQCTGTSATCPPDLYKADGTSCTAVSGGYCASGKCTTRAQQCKDTGLIYEKPEYTTDCLGSCQIFCQASFEGCRYFTGFFLNGTKCGSNNEGVCQGGVCSTGDFISSLIDFVQKNLILVIVAAVVIGLLILGFLFWGCRKANRKDAQLGKSLTNLRTRLSTRRGPGGAPPSDVPTRPPPSNGPRASRAGPPPAAAAPPAQPGQRASMVGDFVGRGHTPVNAPPPAYEHHAEHSEHTDIPLQVRCPICQNMFPSETLLNQHLDTDHA